MINIEWLPVAGISTLPDDCKPILKSNQCNKTDVHYGQRGSGTTESAKSICLHCVYYNGLNARDLDRAQNELDTIRSMYGRASVRYSIRSSQMNLDTRYDPRTNRTCVQVRTYVTNWPVAL